MVENWIVSGGLVSEDDDYIRWTLARERSKVGPGYEGNRPMGSLLNLVSHDQ